MTAITNNNINESLQQQVQEAISSHTPLFIHGGESKQFYGNSVDAKPLDISKHTGVVSYEPTELCITVRAGTRLNELEALLAGQQQILPFEPPQYSDKATIGGAIAAGISGPRRSYTGSVRDAILGVQIINGEGEIVNFGGQVMKNVAGYDLSRLMVRSQGTLGVILNVSIRLLPKPTHELTLHFGSSAEQALTFFQDIGNQQLPVTATAWYNDTAYLRLSASETTLEACQKKIEAEPLSDLNKLWQDIRDHKHSFFEHFDKPLWRLSLPPASDYFSSVDDSQFIEWDGAQRWISSNVPANIIQSLAEKHGGHATLFRGDLPETPKFPALEPALFELHKQLKNKMDPHGIFNPNRVYQGL